MGQAFRPAYFALQSMAAWKACPINRKSGVTGGIVPVVLIALLIVFSGLCSSGIAAGPRKEAPAVCSRYSLPNTVSEKSFQFAGELIPVRRPDVNSRISFQINFLLLDARSVLTDWLSEKSKHYWLLEDILAKEGIPKDFVWLAPILAGANLKSQSRQAGVGWWSLEKNCDSSEGMEMSDDSWHDDRLDLELSTRCFATRIKQIRKDLGDVNWLMAAAAYISGQNAVQDLMRRWNTKDFWDIPLPDASEETCGEVVGTQNHLLQQRILRSKVQGTDSVGVRSGYRDKSDQRSSSG